MDPSTMTEVGTASVDVNTEQDESINEGISSTSIKILKQPVSEQRFRYPSENRNGGRSPDASDTGSEGTGPVIRIDGYAGPLMIFVTCVTKDEPYYAHPYKVIGRDNNQIGLRMGFCVVKNYNENENREIVFRDIRIQRVKKNDIRNSLEERQRYELDPYEIKLDHNFEKNLRLCFQARDPQNGYRSVGKPVLSEPIHNKKNATHPVNLNIHRLIPSRASASKSETVIIIPESRSTDAIDEVLFYEVNRHLKEVWRGKAMFTPADDVHKTVAICIKTPLYTRPIEEGHVAVVSAVLVSKSGKKEETGSPTKFIYTRAVSDPNVEERPNYSQGNNDYADEAVERPSLHGIATISENNENNDPVRIVILKNPPSKIRFRYKSERSYGERFSAAVRVVGHSGPFLIVVSCVTKNKPYSAHPYKLVYSAHPYKLVSKDDCGPNQEEHGCSIVKVNESGEVMFPRMGIQRVLKPEIQSSLTARKNYYPFKGKPHNEFKPKELAVVRLCFQVYDGMYPHRLLCKPVVSEPVYNSAQYPVIKMMVPASAPANACEDAVILCDNIDKNDIDVLFYGKANGKVWKCKVEFKLDSDVYRNAAICFKIPRYPTSLDEGAVAEVTVQLRQLSNGAKSAPIKFTYTSIPGSSSQEPAPYILGEQWSTGSQNEWYHNLFQRSFEYQEE